MRKLPQCVPVQGPTTVGRAFKHELTRDKKPPAPVLLAAMPVLCRPMRNGEIPRGRMTEGRLN